MQASVVVQLRGQEQTAGSFLVRMAGWTLEQYLEEAPEGEIWEFARGEVIMHSPVTAEHQDLVRFLLRLLDGYCEHRQWGKVLMGPAAVQILPDVVREPDLFVLAPEDVSSARGVPLHVRPVLIVEVISPSTRTLDLVEKANDYAQAGVPEYWVVDGERKDFWVHRLQGDRYQVERLTVGRVESTSVPGFWMRAEWLWEDPLPSVSERLATILGK